MDGVSISGIAGLGTQTPAVKHSEFDFRELHGWKDRGCPDGCPDRRPTGDREYPVSGSRRGQCPE